MSDTEHVYKQCVLYTLPKDVTTQSIGEKTIENALKKVNAFLSAFSNKKNIEFYTLDAHIPQPYEKHYNAGLRKIEEAKNLFGPGIERSIGYSYPQGKPLSQRKIEWEFNYCLRWSGESGENWVLISQTHGKSPSHETAALGCGLPRRSPAPGQRKPLHAGRCACLKY